MSDEAIIIKTDDEKVAAGDPIVTGEAEGEAAEALPVKSDPDDATSDDDDLFGDASDEEEKPKPATPPPTKASGQASQVSVIEKPIPREKPKPATPPPTKASGKASQVSVIEKPIPRTSPPSNEASRFGLPAGVSMPKSVETKLLQGRLLETLRSLPINLINDALTEYDDAVQIKGGAIRNHGAYLYGVIKRYVSVQQRTKAGEEAGMGASLTPAVSGRLQKLIDDSFCTQEEMNEKVKMKIRMLSESDALLAIDELASVERRQIRNFGSYFMGILNRYMRGEKQMDNKKRQDSNDHRRGRRDAVDDHNESFRGERSRFDQGRSPPALRSQQQHYVAKPPYGQQSYPPPHMGGMHGNPPPPPPPPPRHPGNMNTSFSRHPPQGIQMGPPQHQANQTPAQFVPQSAGLPPSMYGPSHQYNNNVVHSPPFAGGSPMGGAHPPPPPRARNLAMYGTNNNNNTGAPPFQPPPSQSYVNASQPQNNRFSPPQRGGYQQQQPSLSNYQQAAPVVDILGIADMAASAVQALQNQHQRAVPPPMHQMQHQSMYSAPPVSRPQVVLPPQSYPPSAMASPTNYNAPKKGRHATATMQELPIPVQYFIQNLQVTGQIDGDLDDGILGMIKDLPEDLALQALQKFSSIDKHTMRNKTAYLAGVLRRELERINRR